jgi:hypothetical protein
MGVVLVWLALVALIVLEILWLIPLQREWLETKRIRRQGEKGARFRKDLGVAIEGPRDGKWVMRGRRDDRELVVRQAASLAPPWAGKEEEVTTIEVVGGAAPVRIAPVAQLQGSPGFVAVPTGHTPFDEAYALLLPEADSDGVPFRDGLPRVPAWASAAVLESFLATKARWLTAEDGALTLAIPRGAPELAGPVSLALTVAGVPSDAEPEPVPEPPIQGVGDNLFGEIFVAGFVGISLGMPVLLGLIRYAPFRSFTVPVDCGPGDHLGVETGHTMKGQQTFEMICAGDPNRHLFAHWLLTFTTHLALILLGLIAFSYYRRRPTDS